ncbi:hypothetical protein MP638_000348 [Amoeboaphelidium occidentale]|nr:hypothetical protein MP638_000348 [Amoeboaphelidium occidentale]
MMQTQYQRGRYHHHSARKDYDRAPKHAPTSGEVEEKPVDGGGWALQDGERIASPDYDWNKGDYVNMQSLKSADSGIKEREDDPRNIVSSKKSVIRDFETGRSGWDSASASSNLDYDGAQEKLASRTSEGRRNNPEKSPNKYAREAPHDQKEGTETKYSWRLPKESGTQYEKQDHDKKRHNGYDHNGNGNDHSKKQQTETSRNGKEEYLKFEERFQEHIMEMKRLEAVIQANKSIVYDLNRKIENDEEALRKKKDTLQKLGLLEK